MSGSDSGARRWGFRGLAHVAAACKPGQAGYWDAAHLPKPASRLGVPGGDISEMSRKTSVIWGGECTRKPKGQMQGGGGEETVSWCLQLSLDLHWAAAGGRGEQGLRAGGGLSWAGAQSLA